MSLTDEFTGDVNLGVGELYGIRKWKLTEDGILRSYSYDFQWNGTTNTAECLKFHKALQEVPTMKGMEHPVPMKECSCGFWAYYDPNGQYMSTVGTDTNALFAFEGIVKSWGKVIAGPRGFRAQYAKIVAICVQFPVATNVYSLTSEKKQLRASVLRDLIGINHYPNLDIVAKRTELLDKYPLSKPLESRINEPN